MAHQPIGPRLCQASQGWSDAEPSAQGEETGQAHTRRDRHQDVPKLGPGRGARHDVEVDDLRIWVGICHDAGSRGKPREVLRYWRAPGERDAKNDHVLQGVDPVQGRERGCQKNQEAQLCQRDTAQHDIAARAVRQSKSPPGGAQRAIAYGASHILGSPVAVGRLPRGTKGSAGPRLVQGVLAAQWPVSFSIDQAILEYGTIGSSHWTKVQYVNDATIVVYQPQAITWKEYRTLEVRMAVAVTRKDTNKPILGAEAKGVELKNDPPVIFYSSQPTNLVVFDGEPVLSPVQGTDLSFVVNTNWDVFFESSTSTYYLLDGAFWVSAPHYTGPWHPVTQLPSAFNNLPNDKNFTRHSAPLMCH